MEFGISLRLARQQAIFHERKLQKKQLNSMFLFVIHQNNKLTYETKTIPSFFSNTVVDNFYLSTGCIELTNMS